MAGFFHTTKNAARRLAKLEQRKSLRSPNFLGGVHLRDVGRKRNVWGGWRPSSLNHEVRTTRELVITGFPLWDVEVLRGKHVDPNLRPDATVVGSNGQLHFEIDLNHEGRAKLERQIAAYELTSNVVIWVAPTRARVDFIKRLCGRIRKTAIFSVMGSAVYEDLDGNTVPASAWCETVGRNLGVLPHPVDLTAQQGLIS